MDFIEWCDLVLDKLFELSRRSAITQVHGVEELHLLEVLFNDPIDQGSRKQAVYNALRDLQTRELVRENGASSGLWIVNEEGKRHSNNRSLSWNEICIKDVEFPEQKQILAIVNRFSPRVMDDHVWLEDVAYKTLLAELEWSKDIDLVLSCSHKLIQLGFVDGITTFGSVSLRSTYSGLVWDTRCVKSKVFMSYRRIDSEPYVLYFAQNLEPFGINCFVDTKVVDGAGPFPERLSKAIEECDVFVCFLGRSTFASEWTKREIELADRLGKPMIPLFQPDYPDYKDEAKAKLPVYIRNLLSFDGVPVHSGYVADAVGKLATLIGHTWYKQFK